MSAQSAQPATNEDLKQINKPITDLKSSVDKSMTDLKASVDQVNANVASMATKFQEFEKCLEIAEVRMEEIEEQCTVDDKHVSIYELESSAKVLRIQNAIMEKDEVVYTVCAKILSPILNITPQEIISEIDHAYRLYTAGV